MNYLLNAVWEVLEGISNVLQTGGSAVMCMMFGLGRDAIQYNTITNSSVKKFLSSKKKKLFISFSG